MVQALAVQAAEMREGEQRGQLISELHVGIILPQLESAMVVGDKPALIGGVSWLRGDHLLGVFSLVCLLVK